MAEQSKVNREFYEERDSFIESARTERDSRAIEGRIDYYRRIYLELPEEEFNQRIEEGIDGAVDKFLAIYPLTSEDGTLA